ncbi:MAG: putative TrmH family tRNA/rRNA methyltransferase [Chlorobi bacterium]|nr:MAG: 23S rRNA (guanosine(2251)-2'-O)-methyltransferase RlmB [Bacteroidota bacterium]KXK35031.1 MAG: TrmH family rRNA methyltransferase [Chlorobi bacterium OLB6]MBV6464068.1 putative TrmH family tRNA/rRNA methyltransferase [Chlorobiota bacterium]MBZ0194221.1 23S rRNA (guanosine(2251)-2'-O)-methyltransferase RlmB [Candidatus Kapabacteria bacterium]MCC6331521.1 23S rRNA (guanosine(2251)-2'-O)-methyltransferase RlmB [Ignavibacteria bacterium]
MAYQQPPSSVPSIHQRYIVGKRAIAEALAGGITLEKIFFAYGAADPELHKLRAAAERSGVAVATMDKRKFAALEKELSLEQHAAQNVVALRAPRTLLGFDEFVKGALAFAANTLIVVADGITDPHNLGAIARSAECAGAYGLIIPDQYSAPITPAAVKSSAGALELLPVCKVPRVSTTVRALRTQGWTVVGTATPAQAPYTQADYRGPTALVIGNEGEGLHPRVLEECSIVVEIPMHGRIASLNASVAAAVVLFEAVRQRTA